MAVADFISGYNVIRKLGDGARSQVFQVVRVSTGEVFALKRVTRESHEDTRFLDQAINGHEIAHQLSHPYLRRSVELRRIRRLLKLIEVQVIMEFVDGRGLSQRRPERLDKTIDVFLKVAEGLNHMHEHGLLHTDIKPNNILLTNDGSVKIIDFGQSCRIGFRKPRIQGTPDYIAPEQVERRSLTRRTDVFNLGATLYWALTGQAYPTVIGKGGQRQDARRQDLVPTPRALRDDVPAGLSRFVMECCLHDPLQRPKDMKEVLARIKTIQHVLKREDSSGEETSPSEPAAPSSPKSVPGDEPHSTGAGREGMYDFSAFQDLVEENDPDSQSEQGGKT